MGRLKLRPFQGYNPPRSNQQSGVMFWQWFDSISPADRKTLNDYAGPQEGFRDLVEAIATRMAREQGKLK